MAIVENQIVSIEYEVKDNGTVVDSNVGAEPLVFMFGKGQIIPGLENGLSGYNVGDKGDILVAPEDAYGEYNDEAVQEVPKDQFSGIDLSVGMTLYGQSEDGGTVQVIVKEIKDESVVIDYNHPLAGKSLMFTVTLNSVREATPDEILSGIPAENAVESGCCSTEGGHSCGCH